MNNPRILYIDDELDLLDLAQSFFEDENLQIEVCAEFNEALTLIRTNNYDLIISDAKMPSGSGYDLFHIIKNEGHFKGKIILVTGNMEPGLESQGLYYDLVIYKPIRFQELIAQVKLLLA